MSALGGLDISYNGKGSGLIVDGGLEDANNGFSAHVTLYSPSASAQAGKPPKPVTLASTGIMIGKPDPAEMFPSQVYFRPWLKLRNVTSAQKAVTVTGTYMYGLQPVTVPIAQLTLNAMAATDIDVEGAIHALNLPPQVMELNLAVSYQGYSSDVIISSGSVDDAGSYVFEVPLEVVGTGVSKHICYWKAGDGIDTMVSVWNHDSAAQDLLLTLHFDGGSYDYPIHLNAQSSATVNLFDILHSNTPDPSGHTIPAGIETGSATLAGAAGEVEPINVTLTAASYDVGHATCVYKCVSCNGYTSFSIFPSPWDSPYPDNVQLSGTGHFSTGSQYDLTAGSTWSSNNTSVANVGNASSAGLVGPVAPGSATIYGTTDVLPLAGRTCGDPPDCGALDGQLPATAPGSVVTVTISMRDSGQVSSNNSAENAWHNATGGNVLGEFAGCLIGVEFAGAVNPSNYSGTVTLHREVTSVACYLGSTSQSCNKPTPPFDDTSDPSLLDTNPAGSGGNAYDLDGTGVDGSTVAASTTKRLRVNFYEYATDASGKHLSPNFNWFARVSCTANSSGTVSFANDVSNDNQVGQGATNTSWNLQ